MVMRARKAFLVVCLSLWLGLPAWSGDGKIFETPQDAVESLVSALEARDDLRIQKILGSEIMNLLESDPVLRRETYRVLALLFEEAWALTPTQDGSEILRIGDEGWPFPVPLLATDTGWIFDLEEGREELLNRRIGRNELLTIETFQRVAEAQDEYFKSDRDGDGVAEYAAKFRSSPGQKDGLYWEVAAGQELSPLQKSLKDAFKYTQGRIQGTPWFGYQYRYLDRQGPNAKGGAFHYDVDGKQTRGYGMVAYPASYGKTGVMTFITSQDGKIFQKDLGVDTVRAQLSMDGFDPGEGWVEVGPQELAAP